MEFTHVPFAGMDTRGAASLRLRRPARLGLQIATTPPAITGGVGPGEAICVVPAHLAAMIGRSNAIFCRIVLEIAGAQCEIAINKGRVLLNGKAITGTTWADMGNRS